LDAIFRFHQKFAPEADFGVLHRERIAALEFESANPSVVKSIKQRDLLNTWLRLYAREQRMPGVEQYQPERLADELPDLVYYTVESTQQPPRLTIQSNGTRISNAYGHTGKGRHLDAYLGARLASVVMPVYYECVKRALPVYTISNIDDIYGRIVAYERLLLPFSEGTNVTHVIASLKTISEDGGFEIKNLIRGNDTLPTPKLRTVIDRDLFHRAPGRIPAGDVIEFNEPSNGICERQFLGGQIRQTARSAQRVAARVPQASDPARPGGLPARPHRGRAAIDFATKDIS
jgi:hypothetical protein